MSFVTKHLCSFTGERGEANLEQTDGTNGKVWCFGFFCFLDKENLFYAEYKSVRGKISSKTRILH